MQTAVDMVPAVPCLLGGNLQFTETQLPKCVWGDSSQATVLLSLMYELLYHGNLYKQYSQPKELQSPDLNTLSAHSVFTKMNFTKGVPPLLQMLLITQSSNSLTQGMQKKRFKSCFEMRQGR